MSGSKGLKRYNGVEQDDEGAYVYYDEHIAALRRAKAEVLHDHATRIRTASMLFDNNGELTKRKVSNEWADWLDARAAQIEEGE